MQSRRAHRSPRQRGFRPQLEAVEERCCPTCSVSVLDGHILQVRGDALDDDVRVVEARDGTVSVTCDGDEPHRFHGIDRLTIDTGAGNDAVSVSAEAGRLSQVTVTLGEVNGPGLLSILTLFPLGALEMARSVEDDHTGHLKHHATAAVDVLRPTSVSLDIDVPFDADVSATFRGPAFGTARIDMIDPGNRAAAFIRYILAEAFSAGAAAFRNLKAIGDMNERLRTASATLRCLLESGPDHFEPEIRINVGAGAGQFVAADVSIDYRGPISGITDVRTGDACDRVAIRREWSEPLDGPTPRVRDSVSTGGGRDDVRAVYAGAAASSGGAHLLIDTGADDDRIVIEGAGADASVDGGAGADETTIATGAGAQRFAIAPGRDPESVRIDVGDIAPRAGSAGIDLVGVESVTAKGGDGDDTFDIDQRVLAALRLFGEGGADAFVYALVGNPPPAAPPGGMLDGGDGYDSLYKTKPGRGGAEHVEIRGVQLPDGCGPHLRVTDSATGRLTADLSVLGCEAISVETGGGDDCVTMGGDARFLTDIDWRIDTGGGDDVLDVLLKAPPARGTVPEPVRTFLLNVSTGTGNDRVRFEHTAGRYFDVDLTADLGVGADLFEALLLPPPGESPSGPPGPRTFRFDVTAGTGNDLVVFRNSTATLIELNVVLGIGNDILELTGLAEPVLAPGPGYDTARVSRNLLPFTDGFERVVLLDDDL